ncbi:MAG: hypothetical protein K6T68_11390 [Alicyclobacillus shizuokensis]|nr:hypothetical protein [Alicyclobacillus shizuokensis]
MNKREIVRCLRLANDLWAIEGANPFRVRAHERAAHRATKVCRQATPARSKS